jgi:FtsZ-binding cell division protein ZapB
MSPDLSPEVRAEAAKAAYEAETSGTHDFGLEPKPWAKLRPDTREYYLRLSDAVVSVVLPAQVDALKAELKRELQAEDEAAETAHNRRLAERIEAGTDVMPFDEVLQLACRVGEANLDVSGPRVVQLLVKKIDQLKAELNALRAGADELQAENERLREERDAFKGASETWAKRYRDLNEVALNDLRNPDVVLKARVGVLTAALTRVAKLCDRAEAGTRYNNERFPDRPLEITLSAAEVRAALAAGEEKPDGAHA